MLITIRYNWVLYWSIGFLLYSLIMLTKSIINEWSLFNVWFYLFCSGIHVLFICSRITINEKEEKNV